MKVYGKKDYLDKMIQTQLDMQLAKQKQRPCFDKGDT